MRAAGTLGLLIGITEYPKQESLKMSMFDYSGLRFPARIVDMAVQKMTQKHIITTTTIMITFLITIMFIFRITYHYYYYYYYYSCYYSYYYIYYYYYYYYYYY